MEKLHQKDKILHHGEENKNIKRIKKVHIITKTWHKRHWESVLYYLYSSNNRLLLHVQDLFK